MLPRLFVGWVSLRVKLQADADIIGTYTISNFSNFWVVPAIFDLDTPNHDIIASKHPRKAPPANILLGQSSVP